jgi:hypothetical protein
MVTVMANSMLKPTVTAIISMMRSTKRVRNIKGGAGRQKLSAAV